MHCLFGHHWSWPRRRDGQDVQVCPRCGAQRECRVHFDAPMCRQTRGVPPCSAVAARLPDDLGTSAAPAV